MPACHGSWRDLRRDEGGLSLIELMVSIVIIGFVLAALAGVLVSSLRAVNDNDRLTRATALHNETLETLQALPWETAALYEDEVGGATTNDDGLEYVLLDAVPADERDPRVLEHEWTEVENNIQYDVEVDVVWTDADQDEKRFISRVTYPKANGQLVTSEAMADRTPTFAESSDELAITSFTVSPNPVNLDEENENISAIDIDVRFNQPVTTMDFRFRAASGYVTKALTPSPDFTGWTGTIPAEAHQFNGGFQPFEATGTNADGDIASDTHSVEMLASSTPNEDVTIEQFNITQAGFTPIEVNQKDQLESNITVIVKVKDFTNLDTVTLRYDAWTVNSNSGKAQDQKQSSRTLTFTGTDASSNGVFEVTLTPNDGERFKRGEVSNFVVTARRTSSDSASANKTTVLDIS